MSAPLQSFTNDFGQLSQAWIWDVAVPSQLSARGFKPDPCGTAAAPTLPFNASPDYSLSPKKPPVSRGLQALCSLFPLEQLHVDADTANSPLHGHALVTQAVTNISAVAVAASSQDRAVGTGSDGNVCPASSCLPPVWGEKRNPGWRTMGSQKGVG